MPIKAQTDPKKFYKLKGNFAQLEDKKEDETDGQDSRLSSLKF